MAADSKKDHLNLITQKIMNKSSVFVLLIQSLLLFVFLLSSCVPVRTESPIPEGDDYEILKNLPSFLEGDYILENDSFGISYNDRLVLGRLKVMIEFINESECIMYTYMSFTHEDFIKHPYSKFCRIRGDFLLYKNDSLINLRKNLLDKSKNELTDSEQSTLEKLNRLHENGGFTEISQLTAKNGEYVCCKKILYELDLTSSKLISYSDGGNYEEYKVLLKRFKDQYLLNLLIDSDSWGHIFFKQEDDKTLVRMISIKNLRDNFDFYNGITELEEDKIGGIITVNASESELETLVKDNSFFENIYVLRKMNSSFFGKSYKKLLLGFGSVTVFIIVFFFLKKRGN